MFANGLKDRKIGKTTGDFQSKKEGEKGCCFKKGVNVTVHIFA